MVKNLIAALIASLWLAASAFGQPSSGSPGPQPSPGLSSALASSKIFVGNASGVASPVSLSGDCTLTNAGVITCPTQNGFQPSYGAVSATVSSPGGAASHSYAPGDTITLGTVILGVADTQVTVAVGAVNGTGCTNGTYTATGTTGTGTKATFNVTVTSNVPVVNSITTGGDYTANPTVLTAEPVSGITGCSGVNAPQLSIAMGVVLRAVNTSLVVQQPGSVTTIPGNPVAQTATSGSGTGFAATLTFVPINGFAIFNAVPNMLGVTGYGALALKSLTSGSENTAFGASCLQALTTGSNNACFGLAGLALTVANNTIAIGTDALRNATVCNSCTVVGTGALKLSTASSVAGITAFGSGSQGNNTNNNSSNDSTSFGLNSCLGNASTGSFRGFACFGANTGGALTTATSGLFIGNGVGNTTCASGAGNILIGAGDQTVDCATAATANTINIENVWTASATGTPSTSTSNIVSSTINFANISAGTAALDYLCWNPTGGSVTADSGGTCLASREDMKDIDGDISCADAMGDVMKLDPFWGRFKEDIKGADHNEQPFLGAFATAKVDRRLVTFEPNSDEPRSIRYMELTAVLAKVTQCQQAEIAALRGSNDIGLWGDLKRSIGWE